MLAFARKTAQAPRRVPDSTAYLAGRLTRLRGGGLTEQNCFPNTYPCAGSPKPFPYLRIIVQLNPTSPMPISPRLAGSGTGAM